jgi:1-deoxy-D-xylulose-5-phosphate reductoisomerase
VAVGAFLEEAIGFTDIPAVVAAVLGAHAGGAAGDLEAILAADRWARDRAAALVADRRRRAV